MEVTLKLWVYDRPGVLDRIAGLIRRKGWNISSLTAGDIAEGVSQINIALKGQLLDAKALCDHLAELDFLRAWEECSPETHVICEMLLFSIPERERELAQRPGMRILREGDGIVFVEFTGTPAQVNELMQTEKARMSSCSRSGPLALSNDPKEETANGN